MFGRQGEYASQYNQKYTQEEESQFKEDFSKITLNFVEAKKAGLPPHDQSVQALVQQHFDEISNFPNNPLTPS